MFAFIIDYYGEDTVLNTYNTARKNNHLTKFETIIFALMAVLTLVAITLFYADKTYFEMLYSANGGFIGYVTVLLLIAIFGLSVVYVIRLARYRSIQFCVVFILAGIVSLLLAAQALAGLPDVLHASTHNLFKANTAALHTMAKSVVKINQAGKIAITWVFIAAGTFYVLILPFVYRGNFKAKRFIDKIGLPVPHRNHIIALVTVAVLAVLFSAVCESAVLSLDLTAISLLILFCPENIGVFRR
ncbi:hypothetical protein AAFN85_06025 [Mucilaginibacter sp. CAU 1740]|uniref:hypothetical protein n=1 Tax=Mucilaginibacter sp. CAU 1740 TaxID=3140365 RepID=UPI00325ACD82